MWGEISFDIVTLDNRAIEAHRHEIEAHHKANEKRAAVVAQNRRLLFEWLRQRSAGEFTLSD